MPDKESKFEVKLKELESALAEAKKLLAAVRKAARKAGYKNPKR